MPKYGEELSRHIQSTEYHPRMPVNGNEHFPQEKRTNLAAHKTTTERRPPAHKEKHEQPIPVHSMHHGPPPKEDSRARPLIAPTTSCNPTNKELANSFFLGHGAQHLSLHHQHRRAARRNNNA